MAKLPEKSNRTMWCGPHALAVLSERPYDEVYKTALRSRRKWQRAYWKRRGVTKPDLAKVIRGMSTGEMISTGKTLGLKIKWRRANGTLARFVEMHTVKGKSYLVNITDHFGVVLDGNFIDQSGSKPASESKYARCFMEYFAELQA